MPDQISRRRKGAAASGPVSPKGLEPDAPGLLAVRDGRPHKTKEMDTLAGLPAAISREDVQALADSVPHLLRELTALRQQVEIAQRQAALAAQETRWLRQENVALRADGDALHRLLASATLPYKHVRQHLTSVHSLIEAREAFARVRSAC